MEILEFLGLDEAEQWEEFSDAGIFLSDYVGIDVHNQLYRLHNFYVELSSVPVSELNQTMNAFMDGPRLDKYMAGDLDYIYTDLEVNLS